MRTGQGQVLHQPVPQAPGLRQGLQQLRRHARAKVRHLEPDVIRRRRRQGLQNGTLVGKRHQQEWRSRRPPVGHRMQQVGGIDAVVQQTHLQACADQAPPVTPDRLIREDRVVQRIEAHGADTVAEVSTAAHATAVAPSS
ncbi:hypothetical protein [Tepidimonas sp.]|uniref:hypothetical protein n=1 Tax=Tepidimonas sp. TaxID=2002775 RepID=UPI002FE1EE43